MSGVSPVLVEWFHGLAWGCWCGRDHGLGCPVGMSGSGMGMLLGSRTATPQVFCGAVRCPHGVGLFPSGRVHRWCMVVVSSCREMLG